jgi:hypothetical protein
MIGLKKRDLRIFPLRDRDKLVFDVGQRLAAVDSRLACSLQVKVWPV